MEALQLVDGRPRVRLALLAALLVCVTMTVNSAVAKASGVTFDGSPGTGAPPSTLGPYAMTPFGADSQPLFGYVSSVAGPRGSSIQFENPL